MKAVLVASILFAAIGITLAIVVVTNYKYQAIVTTDSGEEVFIVGRPPLLRGDSVEQIDSLGTLDSLVYQFYQYEDLCRSYGIHPLTAATMAVQEQGWHLRKDNRYFNLGCIRGAQCTTVYDSGEKRRRSYRVYETFEEALCDYLEFIVHKVPHCRRKLEPEWQLISIANFGYAMDPKYKIRLLAVLPHVKKRFEQWNGLT